MSPTVRMESWTSPMVSTAQKAPIAGLVPEPEIPLLSRIYTIVAPSAENRMASSEPRIPPLRLKAVDASAGNEASMLSADAGKGEKRVHAARQPQSHSGKQSRKPRGVRTEPYKSRSTTQMLSDFDELMLKVHAVGDPQPVVKVKKLEEMSLAEFRSNWRA